MITHTHKGKYQIHAISINILGIDIRLSLTILGKRWTLEVRIGIGWS
jgi:hypothetical protein